MTEKDLMGKRNGACSGRLQRAGKEPQVEMASRLISAQWVEEELTPPSGLKRKLAVSPSGEFAILVGHFSELGRMVQYRQVPQPRWLAV